MSKMIHQCVDNKKEVRKLSEIVIARQYLQSKFKNEVTDRIIPNIVERIVEFDDGLL